MAGVAFNIGGRQGFNAEDAESGKGYRIALELELAPPEAGEPRPLPEQSSALASGCSCLP
jgi:hypothetical protein